MPQSGRLKRSPFMRPMKNVCETAGRSDMGDCFIMIPRCIRCYSIVCPNDGRLYRDAVDPLYEFGIQIARIFNLEELATECRRLRTIFRDPDRFV